MIRSLDELDPAPRAVAQRFLADAVAAVPSGLRDQVREDLSAHLCDRLEPGATLADLESMVAELGAVEDVDAEQVDEPLWHRLGAGVQLRGIADRIATTWWNPADDRLLLPRAVGWGWDLNFGAVAARLGMIEPDAEAVPFTATPPGAFRAAAAVPVGLAAATGLHYLIRGRGLPQRLPSHWDIAGRPDRWVGKGRAVTTDLILTGAAAGLAVWAAGSSRPGPSKAGAIAGATMVGSTAAMVAWLRGRGNRPGAWTGLALLASSAVTVGGVLVGMARAGRRAEISQDLEGR